MQSGEVTQKLSCSLTWGHFYLFMRKVTKPCFFPNFYWQQNGWETSLTKEQRQTNPTQALSFIQLLQTWNRVQNKIHNIKIEIYINWNDILCLQGLHSAAWRRQLIGLMFISGTAVSGEEKETFRNGFWVSSRLTFSPALLLKTCLGWGSKSMVKSSYSIKSPSRRCCSHSFLLLQSKAWQHLTDDCWREDDNSAQGWVLRS